MSRSPFLVASGFAIFLVACGLPPPDPIRTDPSRTIVGVGTAEDPIRLSDEEQVKLDRIVDGGISNGLLAHSGIAVQATAPLMGSGFVELGGTLSLSCPTCLAGTGVIGQIAKFSGTSVLGSSVISENAGNIGIGIGNSAPIGKLEIADGTGHVLVNGNNIEFLTRDLSRNFRWIFADGPGQGDPSTLQLQYDPLPGRTDTAATFKHLKRDASTSTYLGVGTANPSEAVDVAGNVRVQRTGSTAAEGSVILATRPGVEGVFGRGPCNKSNFGAITYDEPGGNKGYFYGCRWNGADGNGNRLYEWVQLNLQ